VSGDIDGAVDVVERECPGAVILDLDAEGAMTSWTILELLRLSPSTRNLPVIGLTWNTALIRGSHVGLREHRIPVLRKPFTPGDLYELVDAATASSGIVKPQVDWHWSFESSP
jgi:CheY-like chemotaxis protein